MTLLPVTIVGSLGGIIVDLPPFIYIPCITIAVIFGLKFVLIELNNFAKTWLKSVLIDSENKIETSENIELESHSMEADCFYELDCQRDFKILDRKTELNILDQTGAIVNCRQKFTVELTGDSEYYYFRCFPAITDNSLKCSKNVTFLAKNINGGTDVYVKFEEDHSGTNRRSFDLYYNCNDTLIDQENNWCVGNYYSHEGKNQVTVRFPARRTPHKAWATLISSTNKVLHQEFLVVNQNCEFTFASVGNPSAMLRIDWQW